MGNWYTHFSDKLSLIMGNWYTHFSKQCYAPLVCLEFERLASEGKEGGRKPGRKGKEDGSWRHICIICLQYSFYHVTPAHLISVCKVVSQVMTVA
jgi:hypothetical protein